MVFLGARAAAPLLFARTQIAKIKNKRKRGGRCGVRPVSILPFSKEISANSPALHRKKQLQSGEFHPDRATSRSEPHASTVCTHGTASLLLASPAKNHP